ncbi:helix-turn-helix domain-containing protein [Streptomyces sp. NPDC013457]|uniref:helix-turn-helix domain-containing protein n=1 Tax=Streptomyces sp. NPDC013457 TaxID=3364866 RepID=UPI0036F9BBB3
MGRTQDPAVDEFARRVRELKERSGRSYGALARRLNVSTSTLFRYCSGETVPEAFAVVDHLARLSGATEEERRALHGLWTSADRIRRPPAPRPPTPRPAQAPTPSPAPSPGPSPAPGWGPGLGSGAAPGSAPAPRSGPSRADAEAPPPPMAPAPSPLPEVGTAPAPGPSGGPSDGRRTRLRARTAAVVTAALALFALGPSAAPGPGLASAGGPTPAAPSGPSAPAASSHPPGTATPTAPTTPAAPSGTAAPSPAKTAPTEATPTPTTPPAPPFTWTVASHVWEQGCGHTYLVDAGPGRVPPPPAAQDAAPWARAQGAVHGGNTLVRVSLQGRSPTTAVVLQALHVRVTGRAEPPAWNAYRMDNGCGGAVTPRHFDVNLDKPRPVARPVAGYDASGATGRPIPAVSLPYAVTASAPEELLVTARTAGCDCRWYLELEWSSEGRSGTVRITDDGRPFRTGALKRSAVFEYDTVGHRWLPGTAPGS